MIKHEPTIRRSQVFGLCFYMGDFIQVTSLKHFHHLAIEHLINPINFNDISIFILDFYPESNPSSHLDPYPVQISEFSEHKLCNTSSGFPKKGFNIRLTSSIDSETPIGSSGSSIQFIRQKSWRWGRWSRRF